jgi:hypothetical protein
MNSKIMIDSGAHSLFVREILKKQHGELSFGYYETDEFWEYVDAYAKYIQENQHLIEVYVSVDVIHNPELSWKVQRYLEDNYKLRPLPVYHSGEEFKWFKKYCDNYDYIGVGGLGQEVSRSTWIKNIGVPVFSYICTKDSDYRPVRKIHGFAMTAPSLVTAYPWYSVDSTSWIQFGKYGIVIVPYKKDGKYDYTQSPNTVFVSSRPKAKSNELHFDNVVGIHQNYFASYFEERGFALGKSEFRNVSDGYKLQPGEAWADRKNLLVETIVEPGLSNCHELRDRINLMYYLDLEKNTPEYPRQWKPKAKITTLF